MADNNRVKEQLKEITDRLEQGIQEVFESEKYKEYLDTMSKFYNYSFNNTMLIAMQKPDATLIAGYQAWQKKFDRHVKHGEKGIRIIAPAPITQKEELEKLDPVTQEPMLDERGKPIMEEVEVRVPAFKVISVFDLSQTEGKELPDIAADELTGEVQNYEVFMQALTKVAPVPIGYEEISDGAKGYYHLEEKRIALQEGMSEIQNIKTTIHEIAHAILHDSDLNTPVKGEPKDRKTKEVEAESIAYAVSQHYGIDTSEYSFGYVAGWSSDKGLKELKSSLETIRKTSATLINSIDVRVAELEQHRNEITLILADEEEHTFTYPFDVVSIDIEEMGSDRTAVFKATDVNLDAAVAEFHSGFHGIELEKVIAEEYGIEWVESIDYEDGTIITPELLHKEQTIEEKLLSGKEDRVGIYQLKKGDELHYHRFEGVDSLKAHGLSVEKENYDLIYTAPLQEGQSLDDIFEQFNLFRPEDFTGHSLSVSDIVLIHKAGVNTAHYVDSIGFREISNFLEKEQDINAEKMEEDELAFQIDDRYLSIQVVEDGYDYSIFDKSYVLLDGGVYDDPDLPIMEVVDELLNDLKKPKEALIPIDYDELMEKTEAANEIESLREQRAEMLNQMPYSEIEETVPVLTFYVAECMEFTDLGEYPENLTLKEAIGLYQSIPAERMNGIKGIGFTLHEAEDEIYRGSAMAILNGNSIDLDTINHISEFRNNPAIQEAVSEIIQSFPDAEVWDRETKTREHQEAITGFRQECMSLSAEIDQFCEDYDTYEYKDLVESKEENIGYIYDSLYTGDTKSVKEWLQYVIDEKEPEEDVARAQELLNQIDDLIERREQNPLTKVEELEEANYNQIDGIINNQYKQEEDGIDSNLSIMEKLKRNQKKIASENSKGITEKDLEKKSERGME